MKSLLLNGTVKKAERKILMSLKQLCNLTWQLVNVDSSLTRKAIAINTPINPRPEPPGAVDARKWRKLYQAFWVEQKKFYASFDTAIGILQSMLIYPSEARNDIDVAICQRSAEIPQAEWTPDKQFQAAMTKLRTSYAPRNESDTKTLR
jgi:hypothetical protein